MRHTVASDKDWTVYAGVDHVTSAFVELWHAQDEDVPVVTMNNSGVSVYRPDLLTEPLTRAVQELRDCFRRSRAEGNPYPNISPQHADRLAKAVGFNDVLKEFYRVFD